jgi:hypothetical protein
MEDECLAGLLIVAINGRGAFAILKKGRGDFALRITERKSFGMARRHRHTHT